MCYALVVDDLLNMWTRVRPDFMQKLAMKLKYKIPLALGVGGGLAAATSIGGKLLNTPAPESRMFKKKQLRRQVLSQGSHGSYVPFR